MLPGRRRLEIVGASASFLLPTGHPAPLNLETAVDRHMCYATNCFQMTKCRGRLTLRGRDATTPLIHI